MPSKILISSHISRSCWRSLGWNFIWKTRPEALLSDRQTLTSTTTDPHFHFRCCTSGILPCFFVFFHFKVLSLVLLSTAAEQQNSSGKEQKQHPNTCHPSPYPTHAHTHMHAPTHICTNTNTHIQQTHPVPTYMQKHIPHPAPLIRHMYTLMHPPLLWPSVHQYSCWLLCTPCQTVLPLYMQKKKGMTNRKSSQSNFGLFLPHSPFPIQSRQSDFLTD